MTRFSSPLRPAPEAQRPRAAAAEIVRKHLTIIGEVESLKGMVDEFAVCAHAGAAAVPRECIGSDETLDLYEGLFASVEFEDLRRERHAVRSMER